MSWLALGSGHFVIESNWFKARYWEVISLVPEGEGGWAEDSIAEGWLASRWSTVAHSGLTSAILSLSDRPAGAPAVTVH